MAGMLHAYGRTIKLLKGMEGGGGELSKNQNKIHAQDQCWEHRFGTRPRVFPPRVIVFLHRRPKTDIVIGLTPWAAQ